MQVLPEYVHSCNKTEQLKRRKRFSRATKKIIRRMAWLYFEDATSWYATSENLEEKNDFTHILFWLKFPDQLSQVTEALSLQNSPSQCSRHYSFSWQNPKVMTAFCNKVFLLILYLLIVFFFF